MKTLRQILADKSGPLMSVSPDDPVFYALQVMSDANVGALLVLDGEQLVGIFSERDYARKVILFGKASKDTPVRAIMTDKVLYVTPDRTVDECMAIMTDKAHPPPAGSRRRGQGSRDCFHRRCGQGNDLRTTVHHPANGKIHHRLRRRTCVRVVPVAQAGSREELG
jgi:hypothetical protein